MSHNNLIMAHEKLMRSETFINNMSEPATFLTESILPDQVNVLIAQLNSKILELDSGVGNILQEHEKEFLAAYRLHMFEVQKEIKRLKESITFEEIKRKRDEEILARERERDWFRNEALRLDKICKENLKSLEIWKTKSKMLESDKKMLEEKIRQMNSTLEPKAVESRTISPTKKSDLNRSHVTESAATLKVSPSSHDISYENTIIHMQKELKVQKSWVKKLKHETSSFISKKYNLENLFMECVETVKQDMKKIAPSQLEIATDPIESFTDPEKRKILYHLVAKPEVTELLRSYLFKSRSSITPSKLTLKSNVSKHGLSSHVFSTPKRQPRLRYLPCFQSKEM